MFDFVRSSKFPHLSVFLVGILLRGIPELLVSRYPVGYETITYYAPPMFGFNEQGLANVLVEFFGSGPLFYAFLWFGNVLSGGNPFLFLKVLGPLLYGCLAVSFFVFIRRGLGIDNQKAFVTVLILIFQVAALRISWDRFRDMLGLSFVFVALTALRSDYNHKWWLVSGLAILTVLSRGYIGLVLFVTVIGFTVLEKKDRLKSLVSLAPSITVYSTIFFSRRLWLGFVLESHFVLNNYLLVVQDALSIFLICFLALAPFIVKGFWKDLLLDTLLGWLVFGSFSVTISPWFFVPGYQRWLMLLVFPFSIYAVRGFERFQLFEKVNFKKLIAVVLVFMLIGVGYSSGGFSYIGAFNNSWVPVNLLQSSIAWEHVNDVRGVLNWLDENALSNSSVLVEERFYGWTLIYLERVNEDIEIFCYGHNSLPQPALKQALDNGFRWIYLIWYTDSDLENFQVKKSLNNISIFQYDL